MHHVNQVHQQLRSGFRVSVMLRAPLGMKLDAVLYITDLKFF